MVCGAARQSRPSARRHTHRVGLSVRERTHCEGLGEPHRAYADSNGEDLEGYAGAGLYDSFPTPPLTEHTIDYTSDRLTNDAQFRRRLLAGIVRIGVAVEDAMGSAQDIEGCYANGDFYVVQTRPQV